MCAKGTVDPHASLLMKVTEEKKSHKQKEKDEIVQDAGYAEDLTDSKLTSDGMLCKFGGHTFCVNFMDIQTTNGSVAHQHGS